MIGGESIKDQSVTDRALSISLNAALREQWKVLDSIEGTIISGNINSKRILSFEWYLSTGDDNGSIRDTNPLAN